MHNNLKKVVIYTDGACIGNPGPGGYGAVLLYGQHRKEISGGYRLTTNNRMEMMAAIAALNALKTRCDVTLYTDSRYLVDAISKGWAIRWQKNGWGRNKKEKAQNVDLWEILLDLIKKHKVKFKWIPGHSGYPENEFCDKLSQQTGQAYVLPTEAQWEYACRAGTTTAYSWGDSFKPGVCNVKSEDGSSEDMNASSFGTKPVGSFAANAWGLYDMHGNVCEWCLDWYDEDFYSSSEGQRRNPVNNQTANSPRHKAT